MTAARILGLVLALSGTGADAVAAEPELLALEVQQAEPPGEPAMPAELVMVAVGSAPLPEGEIGPAALLARRQLALDSRGAHLGDVVDALSRESGVSVAVADRHLAERPVHAAVHGLDAWTFLLRVAELHDAHLVLDGPGVRLVADTPPPGASAGIPMQVDPGDPVSNAQLVATWNHVIARPGGPAPASPARLRSDGTAELDLVNFEADSLLDELLDAVDGPTRRDRVTVCTTAHPVPADLQWPAEWSTRRLDPPVDPRDPTVVARALSEATGRSVWVSPRVRWPAELARPAGTLLQLARTLADGGLLVESWRGDLLLLPSYAHPWFGLQDMDPIPSIPSAVWIPARQPHRAARRWCAHDASYLGRASVLGAGFLTWDTVEHLPTRQGDPQRGR